MRFLRARIDGFRNLIDLDLDFSEPGASETPLSPAVLLGPNGSGKTAVLEALVRSSWLFAPHTAGHVMRPLANDLRHGRGSASIKADVLLSSHERAWLASHQVELPAIVGVDTDIMTDPGGKVSMHRVLVRGAPPGWDAFHAADLRKVGNAYEESNPPSLVYLDAARQAPRIAVESVTAVKPATVGELAMGLGGDADRYATRRYQWTKQQMVNAKVGELLDRDAGVEATPFDALWRGVNAMLAPVHFQRVSPDLKLLFETPSGRVEFDDLSAGQQSVVLMFMDLGVRRLLGATVLIDEIELHLHPTWQARIVPALMVAFPTCQFIVTTQSPIVAASVGEAKHLFDLGRMSAGDSSGGASG